MNVAREDIIDAIEKAKVVSDVRDLRDDISLTDQGIDSLGIFNVILILQEKYEIEIPDEAIDNLKNIPDYLTYLNQLKN